jgi:hypothetical protein
MALRDVLAQVDAMGLVQQAKALAACDREGRHGVTATVKQMDPMPPVTDSQQHWRYCPECWTLFQKNGRQIGAAE